MELEWNHNRPVDALQSLSFKDVEKRVTQEIKQIFELKDIKADFLCVSVLEAYIFYCINQCVYM